MPYLPPSIDVTIQLGRIGELRRDLLTECDANVVVMRNEQFGITVTHIRASNRFPFETSYEADILPGKEFSSFDSLHQAYNQAQ